MPILTFMATEDERVDVVKTQWHRFLAKVFELTVGQRGVLVLAEVEVMRNPPKVDILLLRRETAAWTAEQLEVLPDGIRETSAKHVLIEFKYTESLTTDTIAQALGYEYFYRTANGLKQSDVKMFILCAKTPKLERLDAFGYTLSTLPGVMESTQELTRHVPILLLNGLQELPHNAFVKAFASRQLEKAKAFSLLRQFKKLSTELLGYLEVLYLIWSLPEGVPMNEILTPERVLEMGEEWTKLLLQNLPADKLNELLTPESKRHLIEQGIEQGEIHKSREIVLAMHAKALPLDLIADVTGIAVATVQAWIDAGVQADDHA